jgi:TldD protein
MAGASYARIAHTAHDQHLYAGGWRPRDPKEIVAEHQRACMPPILAVGKWFYHIRQICVCSTASKGPIGSRTADPVPHVKGCATIVGGGPECLKRVSMIGNDVAGQRCGYLRQRGQNVPVGVGNHTASMV